MKHDPYLMAIWSLVAICAVGTCYWFWIAPAARSVYRWSRAFGRERIVLAIYLFAFVLYVLALSPLRHSRGSTLLGRGPIWSGEVAVFQMFAELVVTAIIVLGVRRLVRHKE